MNHIEPKTNADLQQFLADLIEYADRLRKYYELDNLGLIDADIPKPAPPVYGQPF